MLTPEARDAAVRLYLLFDVFLQLEHAPNRVSQRDAVATEMNELVQLLGEAGLTVSMVTPSPERVFDVPRPLVALRSGAFIAPEHNRLHVEKLLSNLL